MRLILQWCVASVTVSMLASSAMAASIPSYSVTNLGHVPITNTYGNLGDYPNPYASSIKLSNTGADATLTAPDGMTVYTFPRTDNRGGYSQLDKGFPTPYVGSELYSYGYIDHTGNFLNKSGESIFTEISGVQGHIRNSGSGVYELSKQADGTFGPLVGLAGSPHNHTSMGQIAQALDLNNAGQVLGVQGYTDYDREFFIINIRTHIRTELDTLLPTGWTINIPVAIDDQGRILVSAWSNSDGWKQPSLLLLTPDGLSSTPLATPAPSAFVTLAMAGLGGLARRRWRTRSDRAA